MQLSSLSIQSLNQRKHAKMSSNFKTSNMFDVEGLVAVVTGGGTGIGAMITKALPANGASAVYILGRRSGPLEEVAKEAASHFILQTS
jgi:NADP-dependent 3-hydroxy acid dehydrogenase YdfG